jgi:hypothetical protein
VGFEPNANDKHLDYLHSWTSIFILYTS